MVKNNLINLMKHYGRLVWFGQNETMSVRFI